MSREEKNQEVRLKATRKAAQLLRTTIKTIHKCTVLTFVFVFQMSSSHCNKANFERQYTDLSYSAAEKTRQCLTLHVTYRL